MKGALKLNLLLAGAIFFASCGNTETVETSEAETVEVAPEATPVALDLTTSAVKWTGKKVTGEHYGTIAMNSGELLLTGDAITGGKIVFDLNKIACEDLEGEYNEKLIGHLKSEDFFDVANHPEGTFEITAVESVEGQEGVTHHITGNLTLRGTTKSIKIPANVSNVDGKINATAEFTFDRTDFGLQYGSGKFFEGLGDKMIYDDVNVSFAVSTM